jgi:hypothetical protein
MTHTKSKSAAGIRVMAILVCGTATVIFSSGSSTGGLSPGQIFQKVQERYASLNSYSDEGQSSAIMDGVADTKDFTTRLTRPNFYRVEWSKNSEFDSSPGNTLNQAVWSSGAGDYLQMGWGVRRQFDRDTALANATEFSGGGGLTIPRMFFDLQWKDRPDDSISGEEQLADEKIGRTDCYVITRELQFGQTTTYWIGKQDFLIRQVRTDVSAKAMQTAWAEATKGVPQTYLQGFSLVETHTNIVLNGKYSRRDFVPSVPLFLAPDQE